MVGYGDARSWRPEPLDDAERQLKRRSDTLLGLADELAGASTPEGWYGQAASAAASRHHRMADRMEHLVAALHAARTGLITAADEVITLRDLSIEADGLAHAHGFTIDDTGAVIDRGLPPDVPAGQADAVHVERQATRAELADRIRQILARAERIDHDLAELFGKIERGEIDDGGATNLAMAARAGARQGSLHDALLAKHRISVDPEGMTTFPPIVGKQMTVGEARMLQRLGVLGTKDAFDIYQRASAEQDTVFAGHGEIDGHRDAFRHAYWNSMLANRFGQDWAEQFTTAHERSTSPDATDTTVAMDLHNNEVGRRIAAEHPDASPDELKRHVEQAVRDGDMVVLNKEGRLVPSNEVGIGQTGEHIVEPRHGGADPPAEPNLPDGGYDPGSDGGDGY